MHGPEEAVSIGEAIRLHTREPAYFTFEEGDEDAIAEGMLADFFVLSDEILNVPPDTIRDIRVVHRRPRDSPLTRPAHAWGPPTERTRCRRSATPKAAARESRFRSWRNAERSR